MSDDITPVEPTSYDDIQTIIRQAYDGLKASDGFRSRHAQRLMIGTLAKSFIQASDDHKPMVVIEAGTGTGKTYGYCLPLIPIAKAMEKTLIIATGTVALQEQLVKHDLPELKALSGLDFTFTLAKGRRRYLCPLRLISASQTAQSPLFEIGMDLGDYAKQLAADFDAGWDGDLDQLTYSLPDSVHQAFTTDSAGCSQRRCAQVDICPYIKARTKLLASDVVVTNHALLISDLKLGGGAILPAPAHCFHIIDEGHRLPAEVLSHSASAHLLHGAKTWLDTLIKVAHGMGSIGDEEYQQYIDHWSEQLVKDAERLKTALQQLYASLAQQPEYRPEQGYKNPFRRDDDPFITRFKHGKIPDALTQMGINIKSIASTLSDALDKVYEMTQEAHAREQQDALMKQSSDLGFIRDKLSNLITTWQLMLDDRSQQPHAKWIEYRAKGDNLDFMIAASPIEAKSFLQENLWSQSAGIAITSATLTAMGRFDYYFNQCGIDPQHAVHHLLPSPFNYAENAQLHIPAHINPKTSSHTEQVIDWLMENIDPQAGTLILFTSQQQMNKVYDAICDDFNIQLQGMSAKHQLIQSHKDSIDAGKGSVLIGLDSFGEGLNLPGKYCTHVIIAKLPFPVPNSPVEEAQSDYLESIGKNPFRETSLPLTSAKLTQWTGRLLRSETDTGKVSILDNRLLITGYGKEMVRALPPFRIL